MKVARFASTVAILSAAWPAFVTIAAEPDTFSRYVDEEGNISRPTDFAIKWVHLGSVAAVNNLELFLSLSDALLRGAAQLARLQLELFLRLGTGLRRED